MKPIATHCDAGCGKDFTISKLKTCKVKNGIEKNYFRCPHCKHGYVAYYTSQETKMLQKEMRQLHVKMRTAAGTTQGMELLVKGQELQAKIKQSIDDARRIVEV